MKKTCKILLFISLILTALLTMSSCSWVLLKMSTVNPWFKEKSEIVSIDVVNTSLGREPNVEMKSYFTDDPELIGEYVKWVGELSLVPTIPKMGGGGSSTKMVFTFADGSTKEIYTKHGIYSPSFISFALYCESEYDYVSNMTEYYRFNVYEKGYSIYTYEENPTLVKQSESGAENLGFIPLRDYQEPETEPTHYLEASFGKVYIYSDTLCYIDNEYEHFEYNNGYYELHGTTFSELMK